MFNPSAKNSVILSSFGGLVTEASPSDLPEGASPLNWDVDFLVGSVLTRPGLSSVYGSLGKNFVWVKSFIQPSGQIYTLALASDGTLWRENVTTSPGVLSQLSFSVEAGDSAFSTTAFSREYIALGPADIPYQYDGVNFDRVSQEGPAAPITVQNTATSNPNQAVITAYSIASNVVTITAANSFSIGTIVQLNFSSTPFPAINGAVITIATESSTQFTGTLQGSFASVSTTAVTGTAIPYTQFPISSIVQNTGGTMGTVYWSAGPDTASAGNVYTIFYSTTAEDPSIAYASTNRITPYVYLAFSGGASPTFVTGTYQITGNGRGGTNGTRFYFTVAAPTQGAAHFNSGSFGTYQLTYATVTLTTPVPGIQIGASVNIQGIATPAQWDNSWSIVYTQSSGILAINDTALSAGTATYTFTVTSGNTPVVGDLVNVLGTTNGNGIFNVINAPVASVGSGLFTVTGFNSTLSYTTAAETGTAQTSGKIFVIDPGPLFVGVSNTNSPIFGNYPGTGTGFVVYVNTSLTVPPGTRQAVVMFLTRNGFLTKPSPPVTFTSSSETSSITVASIPIGPPNVIARWIAFTEAGANGVPGAYFYVIPQPVQTIVGGQPFTYQPTVINDNVSTSATFSFTDAVLLSSLEIDITGGNQFALLELGESQWNVSYGSRMFYGLVNNKVPNFLNMSFNGGYIPILGTLPQPLGWTADPNNGGSFVQLVSSASFGQAYYALNNTGSTQTTFGMLTQSAYVDAYQVPILLPNTLYSVRVAARIPSGSTSGNLVIDLTTAIGSTYGPVLGSFTVPFSSLSTTLSVQTGTLLTSAFSTVPGNLVLRVYATNIANNADLEIDRISVFPTLTPVLNTQLSASYVNNPESFDGITGVLGAAQTNTQPLNGGFVMYDQLYLLKTASMYSTQQTPGSEPSGWSVHEVSNRVGTCGINSYDVGEEWCVTACRSGLYIFYGKQPIKVSQEIFQVWEAIHWAAASSIWVRNDIVNRRILVGVPMATPNQFLPNAPANANPTTPNVCLMLNYLGLGDVMALGDEPQLHTTMFGTLMSVDMRRKWSIWQIASPLAQFITQQDGLSQPLFFCGSGVISQLLASQLSDNGAVINGSYTTYGFVDLAKAQQYPLLGFHRKIFTYLQTLTKGSGSLIINLLSNNLIPSSPFSVTTLPLITLAANPADDYERPINIAGNRLFVQVSTNAVGAAFELSRLILCGSIATLPIRGSAAQ